MSFRFNEGLFRDDSFNEQIKEKLTSLLTRSLVKGSASGSSAFSSSTKEVSNSAISSTTSIPTTNNNGNVSDDTNTSNVLQNEVKIKEVDFPVLPRVEILDMDISTQPRSLVRAIGKVSCREAMIQMETVIESNLLMSTLHDSPSFVVPTLIANNSFKIPITMTFSNIKLEAITNIFMRNYGISISFNDVNLDFQLDCSINILQSTIEKRLKDSIHSAFKESLPTAIFNTSQTWFNKKNGTEIRPSKFVNSNNNSTIKNIVNNNNSDKNTNSTLHKVTFDESDFQELSNKNMLRLSNIVSSRHTLSLNGTSDINKLATITGCLERQNLYRFISRMPSLKNYYMPFCNINPVNSTNMNNNAKNDENLLPKSVLDSGTYDLNTIINIQNKLYQRSYMEGSNCYNNNNNNNNIYDLEVQPKRRIIKLSRKKKSKKKDKITAESVKDFSTSDANVIESEKEKDIITSHQPIEKVKSSIDIPDGDNNNKNYLNSGSFVETNAKTNSDNIIYHNVDNKSKDKISSPNVTEVPLKNPFADLNLDEYLLTNNMTKANPTLRRRISSSASTALAKSINVVGLNHYSSQWGYVESRANTPMPSPSLSPPPYSVARYEKQ